MTCCSWIAESTIKNPEQIAHKLDFFFFFGIYYLLILNWREDICNVIFKTLIALGETGHYLFTSGEKQKYALKQKHENSSFSKKNFMFHLVVSTTQLEEDFPVVSWSITLERDNEKEKLKTRGLK